MMSRVVTWSAAALLLASSGALADPPAAPAKKPVPKAAHVPTRPHLPRGLSPQVRRGEAPMLDTSTPAPDAPAQQLTKLASSIKGDYACTSSQVESTGRVRTAMAKLAVATDLDGYWISYDVAEQAADDNPYPAKLHISRTYAPDARAWTSIARDNRGHVEITTTPDAIAPDATWVGDSHKDGARAMVRTHDDRDPKAGTLHLWTELSTDGGKSYVKRYELSCNRKAR